MTEKCIEIPKVDFFLLNHAYITSSENMPKEPVYGMKINKY